MDADLIHIKGLSALQKFLDELPAKLEKNIVRGAMRAGMKVVLRVAKSNIHSISNELAAGLSVGTRVSTKEGRGRVIATLKTKGPHGFVAKFVEYGTRAHFISVDDGEKAINVKQSFKQLTIVRVSMSTVNRGVRRRAGGPIGQGDEAVKALKIAGRFVGTTVTHPGAGPRPFLRPALDAMAQPAIIAAANYIRTRLSEKEGLDTAGVVLEGDE